MGAATIASRLRRARRNGTGFRLDPADLEVLAQLGIYEILAKAEAEEMCLSKPVHTGATHTGLTSGATADRNSGKSRGQSEGFQYIAALARPS